MSMLHTLVHLRTGSGCLTAYIPFCLSITPSHFVPAWL